VSAPRRTVSDLLQDARERLERVGPVEAQEAWQAGDALIVDIRSDSQRERDGTVPGALFHPRNVLEWRLDPASEQPDPALTENMDRRVVIMCDAGYASSLAAVMAQELGYANATDLDGGFQAWRDAGLPVDTSNRR
jgi:rhodanese-related sulfurtransferase